MYIPDSYLDELIASDIPSGIDLTTHVLGIGAQLGRMEYYTRDAALLCGTEEAASSAVSAARWSRRFPAAACLRLVTCS